jgi:hypothetical protein
LANVLHNTNPNYLLFSDNCYFYAGTIIKVLQEWYNPRLEVKMTGSQAVDEQHGLLGWKGKGKKKELKAGTFHSIKIYTGEMVIRPLLMEKFDEELQAFRKKVCLVF